MVDMPEGTPLETTARVASALGVGRAGGRAVVDVQQYAGTAAPYNFNGLVRHYFLRRGAAPGRPAGEPRAQGRAVASRATTWRGACATGSLPIARPFGATLQVAEVPPGPPVPADAGGRGLRARRRPPDGGGRAGARRSSSRRPAWSMSTGTSRRRTRRSRSWWTARRPPPPDCRRPPSRRWSAWPALARSSACCTMRRRAKTSRSSCGCRARDAQSSRRFSRCGSGGTRPVAVGELTRAVRIAGRAEPVSQEPAGR